ncbi:MAG: glycine betaine ABC transporter substrate-binding protein [Deinococcales bacterium]
MKRLTVFVLAAAMLVGGLAFAQQYKNDTPIRVGSKQFTEQIVLGKMIIEALRANGYQVTDKTNLGTTAVNRNALVAGEIDVYPNYTGTAISNWYRDVKWANDSIPAGASGNAYQSYTIVSSLDAALHDLVWLEPAPANNTYALAVTAKFAQEHNLKTVADLAKYVNDGGTVKLATNGEFAQRPDGLQSFYKTYGFKLSDSELLVIQGGTPAQTEQALANGSNGVNVAMAYGTDGALKAYNFVVLKDPDGAQPVFQPTPVFRGEVIRKYPEIVGILNPIFAKLTTEELQNLNAQVEVDGQNPDAVAKNFLKQNGFIK